MRSQQVIIFDNESVEACRVMQAALLHIHKNCIMSVSYMDFCLVRIVGMCYI